MITIKPSEDPVGYVAAVMTEAITCNRQECLDYPQQHTNFVENALVTARDVIDGDISLRPLHKG